MLRKVLKSFTKDHTKKPTTKGLQTQSVTSDSNVGDLLKNMHPEIAYKLIRYQRTHEPLVPAPLAKKLLSLKAIVDEIGGHRQMGLLEDDLRIDYEITQWATTRLPASVQEARADRLFMALVYNSQSKIAPEEKWAKREEDYPYLQPYLTEIEEEQQARAAFRNRIPGLNLLYKKK